MALIKRTARQPFPEVSPSELEEMALVYAKHGYDHFRLRYELSQRNADALIEEMGWDTEDLFRIEGLTDSRLVREHAKLLRDPDTPPPVKLKAIEVGHKLKGRLVPEKEKDTLADSLDTLRDITAMLTGHKPMPSTIEAELVE